ncbi:NTP transferase domain-containing protein [Puerhibacterium puerhi]|uniref:NTP transferase domain-containing protein n=1 Tax=Puerhibacterium puerhi TaxID=2692623 RepID=UPI0013592DEF|nr:NTP transferase domain-containing protein [Puerhibacterium puerhi]
MLPTARAVAVVPLRDGVSGKSRLATALDPAARRRLVAALARHVVGTLLASDGVERVVVVTADPPFAREVLAGLGAEPGEAAVRLAVLPQPADRPGLNAALDVARAALLAGDAGVCATRLLVAHADLPALTPEDVAALLAASGTVEAPPERTGIPGTAESGAADVVVATDRHGTGTNLLVLPLAAAGFAFRFGAGSRAAHEAEAVRRGLRAVVVQRPGTAADLDTLDDWDQLPAAVRTRLAA